MKTTARAFVLVTALPFFAACGAGPGERETREATSGLSSDTTPPTVLSTSPANGALSAAINAPLGAVFSEDMEPASISASTFTLTGPSGAVSGRVNYDPQSHSAIVIPDALLAVHASYTATITTGVRDLAGNFQRAAVSWTFITARTENTPPQVLYTAPSDGDTASPPNGALLVAFSEAIDIATLGAGAFTVSSASGPVAGTVAYHAASRSALFTPTAPLAGDAPYTATVSTAVADLAGNTLAAPKVWTFRTAAAPDATPPAVTATTPADAGGGPITATFGEPIDPRTLAASTFTVGGVSGSVSYDPLTRTATFTPASALAPGATYTATVGIGITDLAQNPAAASTNWTFTMPRRYLGLVSNINADADEHLAANANAWSGSRDDQGLRLSWVVAEAGDRWTYQYTLYGSPKGVDKVISNFYLGTPDGFATTDLLAGWTLFEPINGVLVSGAVVNGVLSDVTTILKRPAAAQQCTSANGRVIDGIQWNMLTGYNQTGVANAMFVLNFAAHRAPTWGDMVLESSSSSGAGTPTAYNTHTDASTRAPVGDGNNGGWVLVPGALVADTAPPTVLSVSPVSGATGAEVHGSIAVAFSEALDGATVNASALTLQSPSGSISGSVTYDALGYVATFTPGAPLDFGGTYTATVAGVKDLAGHALTAPVVWSFSTGVADTTPPTVSSKTPADGASGVAVGSAILATFSEAVTPASVSAALHVKGGAGDVAGTVSYDASSHAATFTPSAALDAGTSYTATVSGVTDLAGNPMAAAVSWSFSTASSVPDVLLGDLDGDDALSVADAQLALEIAVGNVSPTAAQLAADVAPLVNGVPQPDGTIDVGDAALILRKVVDLTSW